MGHQHQGCVGFGDDLVQKREHARRSSGVEAGGGLVREDQPRSIDQGASDADALLLTHRKRPHFDAQSMSEADPLEQLQRALTRGFWARPRETRGQRHVVERVECPEQLRCLKNITHRLGSKPIALGFPEGDHIDVAHAHVSCARAGDPRENVK